MAGGSSSQDLKKRKRDDTDSEDQFWEEVFKEEKKEKLKEDQFWDEVFKERQFWEDITFTVNRKEMDEKECWEEIQKLCKSMHKEENQSMEKETSRKATSCVSSSLVLVRLRNHFAHQCHGCVDEDPRWLTGRITDDAPPRRVLALPSDA